MKHQNYIDSNHEVDPQPAEYATDRLDLAAWLVCLGVSLQRIDVPPVSAPKPNPQFVFPKLEDLYAMLSDWIGGQPVGTSDLTTYLNVRRDLFRRAREEAQGLLPPEWGQR